MSIPSIQRLPIPPEKLAVICFDDGSTDNSVAVLRSYSTASLPITIIHDPVNHGTLHARIQLIEATRTPFCAFLDPDDEFSGRGVREALDVIRATPSADIVQFGCRMVPRNQSRQTSCWWEPRGVTELDPRALRQRFLAGQAGSDLHRKIWRTGVLQRAVASMPKALRAKRILRAEDHLIYGYAISRMSGVYRYMSVVGEIKHDGWRDNSVSEVFQSRRETESQVAFVFRCVSVVLGPPTNRTCI